MNHPRLIALFAVALLAVTPSAGPRAAPSKAVRSKPVDCTLAPRDRPTLDRRRLPSATFAMMTESVGWDRDAKGRKVELIYRHGRETARLNGGVRLVIDQGGCEDGYVNSYAFTIPTDKASLNDSGYWMRRTIALLREVAPANRDTILPLMPLVRELEKQAPRLGDHELADGLSRDFDETTSYEVNLSRKGSLTTITVVYSVAA